MRRDQDPVDRAVWRNAEREHLLQTDARAERQRGAARRHLLTPLVPLLLQLLLRGGDLRLEVGAQARQRDARAAVVGDAVTQQLLEQRVERGVGLALARKSDGAAAERRGKLLLSRAVLHLPHGGAALALEVEQHVLAPREEARADGGLQQPVEHEAVVEVRSQLFDAARAVGNQPARPRVRVPAAPAVLRSGDGGGGRGGGGGGGRGGGGGGGVVALREHAHSFLY
mmetsp:Transcript_37080/g.78096  ORF Transcript_37080/g.78096 Transcript_37080/m.78096 type:complete len:227 (-) Transcript_37080:114-794(-)